MCLRVIKPVCATAEAHVPWSPRLATTELVQHNCREKEEDRLELNIVINQVRCKAVLSQCTHLFILSYQRL